MQVPLYPVFYRLATLLMRVGNSKSKNYRLFHARKSRRKAEAISRLCHRLDRLVERAETFKTGATRKKLLAHADKVREKLRELDN